MIAGLIVLALLAAYFMPTIIGIGFHHRYVLALFVGNLLFGWTLIGWGILTVWACTARQS